MAAGNKFDVWFQALDTVYRGVPLSVVTDWAEQGRLAGTDRVRPTGVESEWIPIASHPLLSDFLYVPSESEIQEPAPISIGVSDPAPGEAPFEESAPAVKTTEPPIEMEFGWKKRQDDDDDDVDMIPLIDISLVLLIFFIMTASVSVMSPVPVPEMKHTSELKSSPSAITLQIGQRANGEPVYAVRVGEAPPGPEDRDLDSLAEAIRRVREKANASESPVEARIACDKEMARSHVRDAAKELDKLRREGKLSYYGAEVTELSR